MIKIAIVDDGVDPSVNCQRSTKICLQRNLYINSSLDVVTDKKKHFQNRDGTLSHGTICTLVLEHYLRDTAELYSVRILNRRSSACVNKLERALDWCNENGIKLLHLSIGSSDYHDIEILRSAINRLAAKGTIIVAAAHNKDIYTIPGAFSNVIGVRADRSGRLKCGSYRYTRYPVDGIEVTCSIKGLRLLNRQNELDVQNANSFAAPRITAILSDWLLDYPAMTLEEIRVQLAAHSSNRGDKDYNPYLVGSVDWIETALVFRLKWSEPFLLDHNDFVIVGIVEIHGDDMDMVTDEITTYLQTHADVVSRCSTFVILGRVELFTADTKNDVCSTLIHRLHSWNKELVLLSHGCESIDTQHYKKWKKRMYLPGNVSEIRFGEKFRHPPECPVIVVYDYQNHLLYSFSCALRDFFQRNDYRALCITNNPYGIYTGIYYFGDIFRNNGTQNGSKLTSLSKVFDCSVLIVALDSNGCREAFCIPGVDLKINIEEKASNTIRLECGVKGGSVHDSVIIFNEHNGFNSIFEKIAELFEMDITALEDHCCVSGDRDTLLY